MSDVPQQAYNPGQEVDASDIPTPRVKIAHNGGRVVNDGLVPAFSLYSQVGRDDPKPKVLVEAPKEVGVSSDPVTFYVFDGPVKKWSWTDPSDTLQSGFEYPEPHEVGQGEKPYRTFDYVIGIPDHDVVLPYKLMLYRTGSDAARRINLTLMLEEGDPSTLPLTLTIAKHKKDTYTYCVPTVDVAEITALEAGKHQEALVKVRERAGQPSAPQIAAPVNGPANDAPALD